MGLILRSLHYGAYIMGLKIWDLDYRSNKPLILNGAAL